MSSILLNLANTVGGWLGFEVAPKKIDRSKLPPAKDTTKRPKIPSTTEQIAGLLQGLDTKSNKQINTCVANIVPLLKKGGELPADFFNSSSPQKEQFVGRLAYIYKEAIDAEDTEKVEAFKKVNFPFTFLINGVRFSPLAYALIRARLDIAKYLLLNGAEFYLSDDVTRYYPEVQAVFNELQKEALEEDGSSALLIKVMIAAAKGKFSLEIPFTVKNLAAIAAEIEISPTKMNDPKFKELVKQHKDQLLYHAVNGNHLKAVRNLLDLGADIFAKVDSSEDSILDRALINGQTSSLELFAKHVKPSLFEWESTKLERMFDAQFKCEDRYNASFTKALLERGSLNAFHKLKYKGTNPKILEIQKRSSDKLVSVCDIIYGNGDTESWMSIVKKGHGIGGSDPENPTRRGYVKNHLSKIFLPYTVLLVKNQTDLGSCLSSLKQFAVVEHWFWANENIFDKEFAAFVEGSDDSNSTALWGLKGSIKQKKLNNFVDLIIQMNLLRPNHPIPRNTLARHILKTFSVKDGVWSTFLSKLYPTGYKFDELLLDANEEQLKAITDLFLKSPAKVTNCNNLLGAIRIFYDRFLNERNPAVREKIALGIKRLFEYIKTNKIFDKSSREFAEIAVVVKDLETTIQSNSTLRDKKKPVSETPKTQQVTTTSRKEA